MVWYSRGNVAKLLVRLFAIVITSLIVSAKSIGATFGSLSIRSMNKTPIVLRFSKLQWNGAAKPRDVAFDLHSRTDYRDKI